MGLHGKPMQCELCARWRSDVAYVPGHGRNGASSIAGHWVCAHCEAEAETNWFVRQALARWEVKQPNEWRIKVRRKQPAG